MKTFYNHKLILSIYLLVSNSFAAFESFYFTQPPVSVVQVEFQLAHVKFNYSKLFDLNYLKATGVSIQLSPFNHDLAAKMTLLGDELYNEQFFQLVYGQPVNAGHSILIGFNFYYLNIKNYGNAELLAGDLGFRFRLKKNFWMLVWIGNLVKDKSSLLLNEIPQFYTVRTHYSINEKLILQYQFQSSNNKPLSNHFSWTYHPVRFLALSLGYDTGNGEINSMIEIGKKHFIGRSRLSLHPELGFWYDSSISFSY